MKWTDTLIIASCLIMGLWSSLTAGQPRMYVLGDERLVTNTVLAVTDNHVGCEQCWRARESGFKLPIPTGHPQSHLAIPYRPPTDQWRVKKRVVFAILDVEWRGKHFLLTNEDKVTYLSTNRYSLRWAPTTITMPPPLP